MPKLGTTTGAEFVSVETETGAITGVGAVIGTIETVELDEVSGVEVAVTVAAVVVAVDVLVDITGKTNNDVEVDTVVLLASVVVVVAVVVEVIAGGTINIAPCTFA